MAMTRTFIAVELGEAARTALRAEIARLARALPGVRCAAAGVAVWRGDRDRVTRRGIGGCEQAGGTEAGATWRTGRRSEPRAMRRVVGRSDDRHATGRGCRRRG